MQCTIIAQYVRRKASMDHLCLGDGFFPKNKEQEENQDERKSDAKKNCWATKAFGIILELLVLLFLKMVSFSFDPGLLKKPSTH